MLLYFQFGFWKGWSVVVAWLVETNDTTIPKSHGQPTT